MPALFTGRPAAPPQQAGLFAPSAPRAEARQPPGPTPAAIPEARPAEAPTGTQALLADPRLWRASSLGRSSSTCVPSGFAALDAELPGGGWPTRQCCEILQAEAGLCEWRLLGPVLRTLLQSEAPARRRQSARPRPTLLLINPPLMPHLPGLRAHGIEPQQLIWIAPHSAQQALWVTEQAIKSQAASALLAWLPQARPAQIRRLQSAALDSPAPIFLFRPLAAQAQSSAAPLRLSLAPGADWQLRLQILKRRGPAQAEAMALSALPDELAPLLPPRLQQGQAAPSPLPESSNEALANVLHAMRSSSALARPARQLSLQ